MSEKEIINTKKLKKGWTTGACATACSSACVYGIIKQEKVDTITIDLPAGAKEFKIFNFEFDENQAIASTIKDAGDDPDITHNCEITVKIKKNKANNIKFIAGKGVGTVTKKGLPLDVGEPAINPKPRQMIEKNIVAISGHNNWIVEVSIKNGEDLAKQTWNPRLGITGGLSILGTSGVVIPYSCSAWIHSIYRGIDVAMAMNIQHMVGSTGKTSENKAMQVLGLENESYIDMGDFVGGMLKYASNNNVEEITISGGFAKMVKLAQGNRDLHSSRSQVDFQKLSEFVEQIGGSDNEINFVKTANTALEVLTTIRPSLNIGHHIAICAQNQAKKIGKKIKKVNVLIVNRSGDVISHIKD
jgi:cobalt-precorrin-5B (C1)-methyltransferase